MAKIKGALLDTGGVLLEKRADELTNEKPLFIVVGTSHLTGDFELFDAFRKVVYKSTLLQM